MESRSLALDAEALTEFLEEVFPQVRGRFVIEDLAPLFARVRLRVGEPDLRPGGTVSGPAMFTAADVAFYIAVLAMIGREPLTVTTNLSIDFLRKPAPRDVTAEARVLKLGRTLAVGDVSLFSPGVEGPVAHANVTYAIPPRRSDGATLALPP
ncbi:MAG: PaaI family thioesterase, partial [Pseudomonadota bacterium]